MRITRLQLLIVLFALVGAGIGGWVWRRHRIARPAPAVKSPSKKSPSVARRPATEGGGEGPSTVVPSSQPSPILRTGEGAAQTSAQAIAVVGEIYRLLARSSGEIPSIAEPLRTAKSAQVHGDYVKAMAAAKIAWVATKNYKKTSAALYTVAQGDTLWDIARNHSPVRQGPGWVAIWKANQRLIKDFDWIEVGWILNIPLKRSAYVMRYWKPRSWSSARALPAPKTPKAPQAPARAVRPPALETETPAKTSGGRSPEGWRPPMSLAELLFREENLRHVSLELPYFRALPPIQYH